MEAMAVGEVVWFINVQMIMQIVMYVVVSC